MLKRPIVWIALAVAAIASVPAAYRGFPSAFSIVSLDILMDRGRALADARAIASRDHLGPDSYREAASFSLDDQTQTFVELEGGGKEAFTRMMRDRLYSAYTWRVRHFREGETNETTISFAPDGRPYGFVERIREDAPGAALEPDAARGIAERDAAARWAIDFSLFRLVEHGQERRPGGRVDHTFTYERPSPVLNEGRYRLRLVVSGDRLTEVTHFVKVPEGFLRRYESMRSANTTLGLVSVVGMVLLYGLGGMGVGLFVMLRRHWVVWRPAAFWGVFIALVQTLVAVNEWPLVWMSYDTAMPRTLFFTQQAAALAVSFVVFSLIYTVSFMTAETLTRRAFGSHPQLWRIWGRGRGGSVEVLGRTVAGYLFVAVFFAYDVGLYAYATRRLGWWSPSEALLHPDVLATYLPWFSAIGNSLQAGFWEECLFRAVPLAGAALIGERLGHRRLAIALAFVVQAVIFGTGHAPYPNQPFFARPVELILPSIGFGLLYVYFGLLPGIILHFTFDTVWFALPLFVAHAPGIWIQRVMVVVVTLVPLWIVVWRRAQAGHWTSLREVDRNAAWSPGVPAPRLPLAASAPAARTVGAGAGRVWLALGAAGLVVCAVAVVLDRGGERLDLSRQQAMALARRAIEAHGFQIGPAWRVMPVPDNGSGGAHEFVSETAGEARRRALLGLYLPVPRWTVRVATFEGDVALRAEEWRVFVTPAGETRGLTHTLPEARAGASLDEASARRLAQRAVLERLKLDAARGDVREISATPQKLSARTDWTFIFADTTQPPLPQGELRVRADLAGDEVASVVRYVFVPEEWERRQSATGMRNLILQSGGALVPVGIMVTMAVLALVAWSRRRFAPRLFAIAMAQMGVVSIATFANGWPLFQASLSTSQPYSLQVGGLIGLGLVGLLIVAVTVSVVLGAVPASLANAGRLPDRTAWRLGVAAGCVGAGILAAAAWLRTPVWASVPNVAPLGTVAPIVAVALGPISTFLARMSLLVSVLAMIGRLSSGWAERRVWAALTLLAIGFASSGAPAGAALGGWAMSAALTSLGFAAVAMLLLSLDLTMVPIALGVLGAIEAIISGAQMAYPFAPVYAIVAAVLVLAVARWWFLALRRWRGQGAPMIGAS